MQIAPGITATARSVGGGMFAWGAVLFTAVVLFAAAGVQASSIALTGGEEIVCAVNQDSGSISLWHWKSDGRVQEVAVGEEPRSVVVSPDNKYAFVTTQRSQTLAIVDLKTASCIAQIPLGGQPVDVVLSNDGRLAFVTQFSGDYIDGRYAPGAIAVVNIRRRRVVSRIAVAARPFAIAKSADGQSLYVTHFFQIAGRGVVSEIDAQRRQVRREFVLAEDMEISSGRGGVFNALAAIALHPNGRRAIVAGMHANVHRGLTQSGRPLSHKTTVQAAIRLLDLESGRELEATRIVSSFSGQAVAAPSAVAFIGDTGYFIDVYFASHDMKVLKYNERGMVAERSLLELPAGPTGIVLAADHKTAFVNCRWSRSLVQVSLADIRQPRILKEIRLTEEPWRADRVAGAKVFHNTRDSRMTPNRWLSCGTCHLDGGLLSDHLVWEFSEQQKPTSPHMANPKSLAVTDFSGPPLLIQGNYQTVQEEDKFIRSFLGGTGFAKQSNPAALRQSPPDSASPDSALHESPELNALAAFVLSLRPRPNPHLDESGLPRDEIRASAARGGALFHSARVGCRRCHRGPHWTRSGSEHPARLFDVGTGIKADVPSLQNVWISAPYLHDGRAPTLRDVVTTYNPHDRHGVTQHLTDNEIDDLVHFLLAPYHAPRNTTEVDSIPEIPKETFSK